MLARTSAAMDFRLSVTSLLSVNENLSIYNSETNWNVLIIFPDQLALRRSRHGTSMSMAKPMQKQVPHLFQIILIDYFHETRYIGGYICRKNVSNKTDISFWILELSVHG